MAEGYVRLWNLNSLPKTPLDGITWAQQQGLLRSTKKCNSHKVNMRVIEQGPGVGRFRCPKSPSCRNMSLASGTFFEDCRLPLDKAIQLMYGFTRDWSHEDVRHEVCDLSLPPDERTELASDTISFWYRYCRELVTDWYSAVQLEMDPLGGEGCTVQIDESMFGHRKYNRGRVNNEHWVLGMIEDGKEDVRMIVVDKRDAKILIPIIQKHVKPGTIIHTDCWKAYDGLEEAGYTHKKVNHSDLFNRFVAEDGTHTQRIEATWRPVKDWFRRRRYGSGKEQFAYYLCEYVWRRHCKKNGIDMFNCLLDAIRAEYGRFN